MMIEETVKNKKNRKPEKEHGSHKKGTMLLRFVLFLIILTAVVSLVNRLMIPKYMYDSSDPTTETYNGFYRMKKDTVDVLILGTSQAAAGFNPQDFYDENQVRAYNLSCSVQNMRDTYYWVKEAFRTQSPKAVILDAYYLFSDYSEETSSRKAIDWMRNDAVKAEDVRDAVRDNPDWSAASYYLTNIRFHTRWTALNENDFGLGVTESPSRLKGFWQYYHVYGKDDFTPIPEDSEDDDSAISEKAGDYLEELRLLCEEHGCTLILVKTPGSFWTAANHTAVQGYAAEHQLLFLDFNMENWYQAVGFNYAEDISDADDTSAHCNPEGARKLGRFLARTLVEQGICSPTPDDQWESTKEYNDEMYQQFRLCTGKEIYSWLYLLDNDRYTVLLSKRFHKGSTELNLPDEMKAPFDALGLDFNELNADGQGYIAVIDRGKVTEEFSGDSALYQGSIRDGLVWLEMTSGDDYASILLDGAEAAQGTTGLNIVVYDNERKCVVDSAVIDLHSSQTELQR